MNNKSGVTLVTMVIIVIVIVIISTISIIGGTEIIQEAKDSKREDNLTAVKAKVNDISLKKGTAGVFTPANSKRYGKLASTVLSGDSENLEGWYILDQEDLEEMGLEYVDESYLVNYEANSVITMNEYLAVGVPNGVYAGPNSIKNYVKQGKIEIGDYVEYTADSTNNYTLDASITGYPDEDGSVLTPEDVSWVVWDIKANGDIVIIPSAPVNSVGLGGALGFVNSTSVIEGVCDIYANSETYGVTSEFVRSMTRADLEDIRMSNLVELRDNEYVNISGVRYGQTSDEFFGNSGYTDGIFYMESDGVTVISEPKIASVDNPIIMKQTSYKIENPEWNSVVNSKKPTLTYGSLIGENWMWINTPCSNLAIDNTYFNMSRAKASEVTINNLYYSVGTSLSASLGIRPMVTLNYMLEIDGGDGLSEATGWKFVK